jgi:hypothetical protein
MPIEKNTNSNHYITQNKLAERWHVSPGTIINWRKAGKLKRFRLPWSSKVLYLMDEIVELEHQNTTTVKEVSNKQKQPTELKRKNPVMSAKPQKEWRI